MKFIASAFFTLAFLTKCIAQNINFTLANPQPAIYEVYTGSILNGDIDNDGDLDLIQSGLGTAPSGQSVKTNVFVNDGAGNFTLKPQTFNNIFSTAEVVLGDLDNDNDLDIIITGINRSDFYRNDGQGNFIYDPAAPFTPSDSGTFLIEDIDGDGDNDLLQFGRTSSSSTPFVKQFFNNGTGVFTQAQNTVFTPFSAPAASTIDLEGDGDQDIIYFGKVANVVQVGVYKNDGSGNFSVFSNSNIAPLAAQEVSVGDVDNDGDNDVLVTGANSASVPKTILYLNDGNGQFSPLANTTFPDLFAGSNGFADLDHDNDLDILLIGSMAGGVPNIFSLVFENLGNNSFVASDSLGGEYISEYTIGDFNGDNKKDIIIQGFVDDTNVYWNETVVSSTNENTEIPITVFPNPTNGQFHIECGTGKFNKIEILDQHGKLIYSDIITGQTLHSVAINVPTGIYILKMHGGKRISTQKILLGLMK